MKHVHTRRILSLLTALALVVSLFSGLSLTVFADTLLGTPTGYTAASQVAYITEGSYVKNWGARGEDCVFLTTYAQNYYTGSYTYANLSANSGSSNASSYTSSALYNALHNMMAAKHTHETTYNETRDLYCYTDCVNNNSSYISSFYSGTRISGTWDGGSTWNREHTWPQSKSSGSQLNDIMMLRPTATSENSSRSNKAYGVSDGFFDPNSYVGSTGLNLRGDCARIMLCCYVRWSENAGNMWGSDGVIESLDLLLDWIAADPVDTWEMARNDAVQSITGARNCFVDYPELAFQLFGRTAPADMTTPSGGSAVSYTVNAVSNSTNYGTVSVNGYTITASPKTGYYAAGYTVTSGSAAVAQNGNVFTVTPSSDCTVRINFAAKTPVTVTYMANGSVYSTATGYAGEALTLPAAATAVSDWTAVGWSTGTVAFTNEKPEYYELGASYTPTANVTLYAVYAQNGGSGTTSDDYALFTGTLEEGSYLVTYNGYVMKGSLTSANRLDYTTLTATNGVITTSDASLVWELSSETISGVTYWRFCNAAAGTYAAATSTNNRATLLSSVTDYARWSVTESGGTYDFQNKSTSRYLRSNGTYGFAAYSTTTGGPLTLYKNVTASAMTYTTSPNGEDYTVTFTTPAGITAPAPMTINSLTGATLPTAGAPEGYTFLGWVTEDYDNVTVMPDPILTGLYKPVSDVTLKALYTKHDVTGPSLIQMGLTDTFANGDKVVIVESGGQYGLYQKTASNIRYADSFEFTNDASDILADELKYFDVTETTGGWYLGDATNGWLYHSSLEYMNINKSTDFMTTWILTTYDGYLALKRTYDYNDNVYYVRCSTNTSGTTQNKWNVVKSTAISGTITLNIYKLDEGGDPVDYYTTLIGAEHVHTPGSPVIENNVEPTCTAPGSYDSVVYCADCGEELSRETVTVPALGHDYEAAVTEPTCTEPGYTTYTCSRCGDSYVGDHAAALGHLAGAPVQENYVAPTTTAEGGYDTVTYCQRCGAELSREHTVLPIIEVTEPIETTDLHIYNSISVGTDMVITFTARKNDLTNYNNFWIEVVKHNPDGDVTCTYEPEEMTEGSSTWAIQFRNIYAKEMGVDVEARLYAENAAGQVYMSPARNANIRDYLAGRLIATNNSVEQRVLAADMLNYGAAAQMFMDFQTDHLVNEEISNEARAKLLQYQTSGLPAVNKTNYNTRPAGQPNILFTSVTLGNEVLLNLTIRLTEGTEGVQVLVKNHETGAVVTTLDTTFLGSTFNATFNGIGADAMRTEFDLVTVVNGVETGNIRTWSVEAYVGEIRTEGIALKVAMGNALLTYGDSAAAYFAAQ